MKPLAIILGGTALLVAGAGGAMLLMNGQRAAQSPAADQARPPEPPAAAAPPPSVAAPPPPAAPAPSTIAFVPLVQDFSAVRDTAAFVSASQDAPQFYPLKSGTPLVSAARSPDGAWTVAMTEDGRAAFIPSGDLGPYDASRVPQPALPQTVSGTAEVVDTGTLIVDGQTIPLAGVIGRKGEPAAGMQKWIAAQGNVVNCTLQQAGAYLCTVPPDRDVGRFAIFNGAADLASDASDDYRAQDQAAQAARRGKWK